MIALSCALSHLLSRCGSLVGSGMGFPEKAYNRRSGGCFWETDPYVCLWSMAALKLLLAAAGRKWLVCVTCLAAVNGWWLWFRVFIGLVGVFFCFAAFQWVFWLIGFFFYFSFSFYLLEWLSSVYFCCLLLLLVSSPGSTTWYNFSLLLESP